MKTDDQKMVSVILPTWNRAHLLPRAIRSVLLQTHTNFELIVVDDASTDNTKEVVSKFNDKRIKFIRLDYDKRDTSYGAAKARNVGIKNAIGEYIAFQDSDDEWFTDKLKTQVDAFENADTNVGIVFGVLLRNENGKSKIVPAHKISVSEDGTLVPSLLKTNYVSLITAMVKNECFTKNGLFDELMPKYQEWELWIRFSTTYRFKFIDKPVATAYAQKVSVSTSPKAKIEALERILEKHYKTFQTHRKVLALHYYNLGKTCCGYAPSYFEKGKQYLKQSLVFNLWSPKTVALVLLTTLGKKRYNSLKSLLINLKAK